MAEKLWHTVLAVCLLCTALPPQALGQGLTPLAASRVGASANQMSALSALYAKSKSAQLAYRRGPTRACSRESGHLCGPKSGVDGPTELMLASSPASYDSRNIQQVGGYRAVSGVRDQGKCNACAIFSVLAAAEGAVAAATREDATGDFSEQQLAFCTPDAGELRMCQSTWSLSQALRALTSSQGQLLEESCLPYAPEAATSTTRLSQACTRRCNQVAPEVTTGGTFKQIITPDPVTVQQYIRLVGGLVTRFEVYSDFVDFFKSNKTAVYPGPGRGATSEYSHAVVLVGYDLERGFWIAKNHWGDDWADGGFFRVAFGACNIADPSDTYAVIWQPKQPTLRRTPVVPVPGRPDCYTYLVRSSEPYLSKVADVFGVGLKQLLLDNLNVISALDESPVDKRLVICNPDRNLVQLVLPGGVTPAAARESGPIPSAPQPSTPRQPAPAPAPQPRTAPALTLPSSTRQTQQQRVWRTRQGCTCVFFLSTHLGQGPCNWYPDSGGPWCYTDQSNGVCGDTLFLAALRGNERWDYMVDEPPPQVCRQ